VIAALARLPALRLLRLRRGWVAVGGWLVLAVAISVAARSHGSPRPTDHVLLGAYGPFLLPLVAYGVVGAALGARSLAECVVPLVSFGAPPGRAAAITGVVAATACSTTAALLAGAMVLFSHGSGDAPLGRDLVASIYAGALGGAAYGSWFTLGASIGRRGGGRALFLLVDWVLGASSGASALVTPRGHLRNLLGGTPPMELSERASAALLVALSVIWALVAVRRAQRRAGDRLARFDGR
jgi:hypothetical protein